MASARIEPDIKKKLKNEVYDDSFEENDKPPIPESDAAMLVSSLNELEKYYCESCTSLLRLYTLEKSDVLHLNYNRLNVAITTSRSEKNKLESFENVDLINKIQIGKIIGITNDPSSEGDLLYQTFSKIFNLSNDDNRREKTPLLEDSNSISEILMHMSGNDVEESKSDDEASPDEKICFNICKFYESRGDSVALVEEKARIDKKQADFKKAKELICTAKVKMEERNYFFVPIAAIAYGMANKNDNGNSVFTYTITLLSNTLVSNTKKVCLKVNNNRNLIQFNFLPMIELEDFKINKGKMEELIKWQLGAKYQLEFVNSLLRDDLSALEDEDEFPISSFSIEKFKTFLNFEENPEILSRVSSTFVHLNQFFNPNQSWRVILDSFVKERVKLYSEEQAGKLFFSSLHYFSKRELHTEMFRKKLKKNKYPISISDNPSLYIKLFMGEKARQLSDENIKSFFEKMYKLYNPLT